jgi:hypothetical protein
MSIVDVIAGVITNAILGKNCTWKGNPIECQYIDCSCCETESGGGTLIGGSTTITKGTGAIDYSETNDANTGVPGPRSNNGSVGFFPSKDGPGGTFRYGSDALHPDGSIDFGYDQTGTYQGPGQGNYDKYGNVVNYTSLGWRIKDPVQV